VAPRIRSRRTPRNQGLRILDYARQAMPHCRLGRNNPPPRRSAGLRDRIRTYSRAGPASGTRSDYDGWAARLARIPATPFPLTAYSYRDHSPADRNCAARGRVENRAAAIRGLAPTAADRAGLYDPASTGQEFEAAKAPDRRDRPAAGHQEREDDPRSWKHRGSADDGLSRTAMIDHRKTAGAGPGLKMPVGPLQTLTNIRSDRIDPAADNTRAHSGAAGNDIPPPDDLAAHAPVVAQGVDGGLTDAAEKSEANERVDDLGSDRAGLNRQDMANPDGGSPPESPDRSTVTSPISFAPSTRPNESS